VILAIDVSGSMRAEDMKPNRIEAAKSAARAFVERQEPSTRVGVVSFSGGAFMVQAPTSDHIALLDAINRLNTQRATAIGSGLLTSLDAIAEATGADLPPAQLAIVTRPSSAPAQPTPTSVPQGTYSPAIIILLTDGQNTTGPLPLDAAKVAAGRGVRVFTIGIGTLQGATLSPPGGGDGGFGGAPGGGFGGGGGGFGGGGFRTQLDEATLKQVAKLTDAKYYHASTTEDLHEIYEALDTQLVFKPQNIEVTAFFTAAAAAFLLVGGALSLLWPGVQPVARARGRVIPRAEALKERRAEAGLEARHAPQRVAFVYSIGCAPEIVHLATQRPRLLDCPPLQEVVGHQLAVRAGRRAVEVPRAPPADEQHQPRNRRVLVIRQ
ncbi:MAG: VWA domain-containing protein, partial [Chloroflexi bacterium]|nr:VWA domain-containing protein [Chloroflexota bacterium]